VPGDAILAIESGSPLSDPKLNALVNVTKQLVSQRGYVPRETINAFIEAGYSKDQLLEVLVGVGLKTISNYFDHVAAVEVDLEFLRSESN
jgi:alkylhydroperoxidase family enzyme